MSISFVTVTVFPLLLRISQYLSTKYTVKICFYFQHSYLDIPMLSGRGLVKVIVVHTWNFKLVKMYLDYVWICHSNSFRKAERLLSLDCNRDPFYVFIKTFRE